MYCIVLRIKSHAVRVKALQRVVSITAQAVIVPLWFIFLAMTKQLPVVALPSITRIAISFSSLKPIMIATGRKIIQKSMSFIKVIPTAVLIFCLASEVLNEAPSAIRERGVAIFPR